tara:strand:+ start:3551 stop:3937 length:387 start_codon:yes stop_codon:yes gene_type:complete
MQAPVFEQVQPQRFDSWREFEDALDDGPPWPADRPRKYMMFGEAGRFFPYGLGETPTAEQKQTEIEAVYETSFQKAVSGGSHDDLENRWMSQAFLLMVAAACLIVIVLIALVLVTYIQGEAPPVEALP